MLVFLLLIVAVIAVLNNFALEKKIKILENEITVLKTTTNNHGIVLHALLDWYKSELRNHHHTHINKERKPLLLSYEGGEA